MSDIGLINSDYSPSGYSKTGYPRNNEANSTTAPKDLPEKNISSAELTDSGSTQNITQNITQKFTQNPAQQSTQRKAQTAEQSIEILNANSTAFPPTENPQTLNEPNAAKRPSIAELEETVTKINDFVQSIQRELRFSIDNESGETVVKVVEKSTNEVVRQIPAEDLMESLKHLNQSENSGVIISGHA